MENLGELKNCRNFKELLHVPGDLKGCSHGQNFSYSGKDLGKEEHQSLASG